MKAVPILLTVLIVWALGWLGTGSSGRPLQHKQVHCVYGSSIHAEQVNGKLHVSKSTVTRYPPGCTP